VLEQGEGAKEGEGGREEGVVGGEDTEDFSVGADPPTTLVLSLLTQGGMMGGGRGREGGREREGGRAMQATETIRKQGKSGKLGNPPCPPSLLLHPLILPFLPPTLPPSLRREHFFHSSSYPPSLPPSLPPPLGRSTYRPSVPPSLPPSLPPPFGRRDLFESYYHEAGLGLGERLTTALDDAHDGEVVVVGTEGELAFELEQRFV
jgi:hypothetical protein